MSDHASCGCCACLSGAGDVPVVVNRPGLTALRDRIGTYSTFLDAMIRRLSVPVVPLGKGEQYSLHALTTRESDDPAIALLDAWAVVGDVLTFYQERIANEGYLRTATERRSVLELGRLVGYTLKPGVAASVFLVYTLEDAARTIIPAGTKAQSVPGPTPGEQAQMFETSVDTEARGTWNALLPRMHKPQLISLENILKIDSVWIAGTATRIEKGDPILFVFEGALDVASKEIVTISATRRAVKAVLDTDNDRTQIVLEPVRPWYRNLYDAAHALWPKAAGSKAVHLEETTATKGSRKKAAVTPKASIPEDPVEGTVIQILLGATRSWLRAKYRNSTLLPKALQDLYDQDDTDETKAITPGPKTVTEITAALTLARAVAPASEWQFGRSLARALTERSDYTPRLLATFYPQLASTLYGAIAHIASGVQPPPLTFHLKGAHVLRRRASVFGYNAPSILFETRPDQNPPPIPPAVQEDSQQLFLDTPDDAISAGSYVVLHNDQQGSFVRSVTAVEALSHTAYSISGKTTRLTLSSTWASFVTVPDDGTRLASLLSNLIYIRRTSVLAESEELTLAQAPLDRPIGRPIAESETTDESPSRIEIDGIIDGLIPGRRVVVSGERVDTSGTSGVIGAELAMIDNVEQQTDAGSGGTAFSILTLAPNGLAFQYKRGTVKIYANVVKATHGEMRLEILGGGDASHPLQTFTLHQTPLTFVSAPTIAGVTSTLAVRVHDVLWHETDSLAGAGANDRLFVTKTADDGKVSVIFGNGRDGARVPTGSDNVRAQYRSGIGLPGNVDAGEITTAISKPLGVKGVNNPIEATGGADPEGRDDARRNIPVSLQAMGRVVSVRDYADFARTFAGIAKASATALSDGRRRIVHLTVGGSGDVDIDTSSDLYRNLVDALLKYGDPYQPLLVAARDKIVIAGTARVRVDPDYLWALVAPKVRAALLDAFSYDRRDFGQPVYPAEVVATIQGVPGVASVDLDALGGIEAADVASGISIANVATIVPKPARPGENGPLAAQIAYLPPKLADLFILTEITND